VDFVGGEDALAFAGAAPWGWDLAAGLFLAGAALDGAAARALPPAAFRAFGLAAVLAGFAVGRDVLEAEAFFIGAAFRTGAFSARRLGLGCAGLALSLRLLAEVFGEALCGAGREELLFAPLMTGSLMQSTRFSQIAPDLTEAADLPQLNIRKGINQRGSRSCGE
jgi:hypothetical protein